MSDKKIEQPATDSTKPIQTVPAARSSHARWKRRSSIILMLLAAFGIIAYLVRSGLARQYAGLGAALSVIACGGFLIWHAVHLFEEEDEVEERQFHINEATASSPQQNPADKVTNLTTPQNQGDGRTETQSQKKAA